MEAPSRKRPRYTSWELSFPIKEGSRSRFGLFDLFGRHCRQNVRQSNREHRGESSLENKNDEKEPFFLFRMEHREGGAMAQHFGEERILLFRSDQHGAIAKIIYSSNPAKEETGDEVDIHDPDMKIDDGDNEAELSRMAQAKFHVVSVKESYRGYDLGGLLFSEALSSLRHRYVGEAMEDCDNKSHWHSDHSIRCHLDAEEDIRRHNKLVGFYEQLGCQIKPKAKISYINNNDGETYRKVPMQIALRHQDVNQSCRKITKIHEHGSLINFLPVVFLEAPGKRVGLSTQTSIRLDWLAVEVGEGRLQFRTTTGLLLVADPDGQCKIKSEEDNDDSQGYSKFQLLRVSDARQKILEGEEDCDDECTSQEARQKELWMVQSTHGSFLALDPVSHYLACTKQPAFWQTDDHDFSLTCTSDTPPRRHHYRTMWAKQTVEYATRMRQRYLKFSLPPMGLKRALDLLRDAPAKPFSINNRFGPSLRTLLVRVFCDDCKRIGFCRLTYLFCFGSTGLLKSLVKRDTRIGCSLLLWCKKYICTWWSCV
jgi:ribosomal protein S18 acetylase RimI-like enzyme